MNYLISNNLKLLHLIEKVLRLGKTKHYTLIPILVKSNSNTSNSSDNTRFLNINDLPLPMSNFKSNVEISLSKSDLDRLQSADEVVLATQHNHENMYHMSLIVDLLKMDEKLKWMNIQCFSPNNILHNLNDLKSFKEIYPAILLAKVRKELDWYFSMNMSILYTSAATFLDTRKMISIGLEKLVVLEKVFGLSHKKSQLNGHIDVAVEIDEVPDQIFKWVIPASVSNNDGNLQDINYASKKCAEFEKLKELKVKDHLAEEITFPPPAPLNLNALCLALKKKQQSTSSKQITKVLHSLFEKQMILSPHTFHRTYDKNLRKLGIAIIEEINNFGHPSAKYLEKEPTTSAFDKPFQLLCRPALIPAPGAVSKAGKLTGLEKKAFSLIARYFMAQFARVEKKIHHKLILESCQGDVFIGKWAEVLDPGWKRVVLPPKAFPNQRTKYATGLKVNLRSCTLNKSKTTKQKRIMVEQVLKDFVNHPMNTLRAFERLQTGKKKYVSVTDESEVELTAHGNELKRLLSKFQSPVQIANTFMEALDKSKDNIQSIDKLYEQTKKNVNIHIEHVAQLIRELCKGMPGCDRCGDGYLLKMSQGKKEFYGCSNFPNCKNTQSISFIDGR